MRIHIPRLVIMTVAAAALLVIDKAEARAIRLHSAADEVTRNFYSDYDAVFTAYWTDKTKDVVSVAQAKGSSSGQFQYSDSFEPDVITAGQPLVIDSLHANERLIAQNWTVRLPSQSVPFFSTVVFVVRKDNPKLIKNWSDLVRPEVSVVTPNPKTSEEGRYCYLAAWGSALKKSGGDEKQARAYIESLYANVPILDRKQGGSVTTFADRGIGDVLLTLESEAADVQKAFPDEKLLVLLPPVSIQAGSHVAWLDTNVQRHHTEAVARAYLDYLYSESGQELAASHFFRPKNPAVFERYSTRYKPVALFTVEEIAGGWQKAWKAHFADGGVFDQIYHP